MVRPRLHDDAEILDVARSVFLEHGPGAPIQLVAERVGLSQPALFKRFGTKERLVLLALSPTGGTDWLDALLSGPDQRPIDVQLREISVDAMAFMAIAVPCLLTLRASGRPVPGSADPATDPALRIRAAVTGFFARAHARGLARDVDPARLAMVWIGSLQARAMSAHLLGETMDADEREAHAAAVVDVVWNGIRP